MSSETMSPTRTPHLPGPVGRVVRFVLGVALASLVVSLVALMIDGFSGWPEDGDVDLFVGIFITVWLAPTVWDVGLERRLGQGWHVVGAASIGAGALVGLVFGEPVTGAAFGLLVWIVVTLGWLSVSFVVAAALRTPGCEMRAWRHVLALATGNRARFTPCPGPLQPLDEWEARATGRAEPVAERADG